MKSLILRTVAEAILPVTLLFALHLLLRGHDEPGGGFVAGMVTSVGLVLQSMAFGGRPWARVLAGRAPAVGVTIAALAASYAVVRGAPLLTHEHRLLPIQGLGLATTLIFDVGVFVAVVGTIASVLAVFQERER